MGSSQAPKVMLAMAIAFLIAESATAQNRDARPVVAASGRVTTSVSFDGRMMGGGATWLNRSTSHSGPARMTLDYGQPHARGRVIFGGLVPYGEVWRLGANMATHLTLDLDVRLGGLDIPRGSYSLYLVPREDGAQLIVSNQLRQWGTEFDPAMEFGRVELERRELPETTQSLALTLEPSLPEPGGGLPAGSFRIAWGRVEYFTEWSVRWRDSP